MPEGYTQDNDRCKAAILSAVGGVVVGAVAGVALGLLFAPTSGEELREKLCERMREFCPCMNFGPGAETSESEAAACCPGDDG